jgi:hypothetical protein
MGGSSFVSKIDKARMEGAAKSTNGSITAHEISQDSSQWDKNLPGPMKGALAIPAAIRDVNPA